jgi:hypothetical protein
MFNGHVLYHSWSYRLAISILKTRTMGNGEKAREEKLDGSTRVRTGDLLCVRQMR